MAGGLPQGLLLVEDNATHSIIQADEGDQPRLDLLTIAKTWRIYATTSNVLEANTGNRLENLFWRASSNPFLLRNLHPITFSNVVHYIGSGRGRVQIPRPSHSKPQPNIQADDDSTPVPSGPPTATASPIHVNSNPSSSSAHPTHTRNNSSTSAKSPQSILKKPSVDHSYVEPSSADAPQCMSHLSQHDSTESSSSTNDTVSPTSSERPRMKRQASAGGKKPSFVVNTSGRAKARPSMSRRKSSQGTIPQQKDRQKEPTRSPVKSPIKSPAKHPLQTRSGNEDFPQLAINKAPRIIPLPPGLPAPSRLSDGKSSAFLLPSASSWQSVESSSPGRGEQVVQNSMPLVDPNFRKQFVEARSASQLNLAGLPSKMRKTGSVVRFADEMPDLGRGKSRESAASGSAGSRRGSGAEARRTSLLADNAAIADSDEEEEEEDVLTMLPRTKSQLSLAIEQERRISGSQNLPTPNAIDGTSKNKGNGKGKAGDDEKEDTEDELLKMARKDGVTKAGGPRSRLAIRTSATSHERYRSPTPPPIF